MKESDACAFIRVFQDSTSLSYVGFRVDQEHVIYGEVLEREMGKNFLVKMVGRVRCCFRFGVLPFPLLRGFAPRSGAAVYDAILTTIAQFGEDRVPGALSARMHKIDELRTELFGDTDCQGRAPGNEEEREHYLALREEYAAQWEAERKEHSCTVC